MKWFGRKAGRAVARPVLGRASAVPVVTGAMGEAGAVPQSYEARARAAYRDNPVAQRAVRLVAEGAGGAPLKAGPLAELVKAPSAGQDLVETLATHLLLHGNAFVQLIAGADGPRPAELYALRPERVALETDGRGWPAAYHYRAGEARTRLAADEVVALRLPDPLDDHAGLGCLGAAAGAVALHNQATRWNLQLLANAARPSGALVHEGDGTALTRDQFARLRDELDAMFSGSANAGRPLLLESGLRWQALSLSPADMDFEALKAAAARDIALAFGVPPMLLGCRGTPLTPIIARRTGPCGG